MGERNALALKFKNGSDPGTQIPFRWWTRSLSVLTTLIVPTIPLTAYHPEVRMVYVRRL